MNIDSSKNGPFKVTEITQLAFRFVRGCCLSINVPKLFIFKGKWAESWYEEKDLSSTNGNSHFSSIKHSNLEM